jgi:dTDP-4-dehydrorhamnose reductase
MKVLVLGGSGMLGHKLVQRWRDQFDVWSTVRGPFSRYERYGILEKTRTVDNLDVQDSQSLAKAIERVSPEIVVNAVGVVKQVPTAKDAVTTIEINSVLPHRLAEICQRIGARLITISTDCVFDGVRGNYSEEDFPNATDLYGKSKHLGEVTYGNALTLRTSIIGRELGTAHSLVEWFLSNRGKNVRGFVNAIYSGFPTVTLADILSDIITTRTDLKGLFHLSSDPINKFDLLQLLKSGFSADVQIEPFEEFRIDRSLDSSRFRSLTGFAPQSWETMIGALASDAMPYDSFKE